jgi:hypothetical protein
MKTIYFPYTTIDSRLAEQTAAIWGPLTLLQASPETCLPDVAALQAAGIIETVFPLADPSLSLTAVLQDFQQWVAQHTGGDLAVMMAQPGIPFFNSQSSAQIVARIRKGGQAPAADSVSDFRKSVFQAQLLLAMAQEFDLQQAALARDIEALTAKENEMMAALKGESRPDPALVKSTHASSDAGSDTMVPLRLNAWACAMTAVEAMKICFKDETDILFLTDGPSVLAQIRELFPRAQTRFGQNRLAAAGEGLEVERLPVWLAGPMTCYAGEASNEVGRRPSGFELIEIPHLSVEAFLRRLADRADWRDSDGSGVASTGSCWVGFLPYAGAGNGDWPTA